MKLKIHIQRPVVDVFAFAINPHNTPKWIQSIAMEETNEWPVKIGSIYRNQKKTGEWAEYTVTAFEENKKFVLTKNHSTFHVSYTFRSLSSDLTELEYELPDNGELKESFIQELLTNLKKVMEFH